MSSRSSSYSFFLSLAVVTFAKLFLRFSSDFEERAGKALQGYKSIVRRRERGGGKTDKEAVLRDWNEGRGGKTKKCDAREKRTTFHQLLLYCNSFPFWRNWVRPRPMSYMPVKKGCSRHSSAVQRLVQSSLRVGETASVFRTGEREGKRERGALETPLHQVDDLIQLRLLVPWVDLLERHRDGAVRVRRVLNHDGRVEFADELVEVAMSRFFIVGNVALEGAVCGQKKVSVRRKKGRRGQELTVNGSAALHGLLAEDGGDLGKRLSVVVRVEEGETAGEEAEEDDAGGPDVDCWWRATASRSVRDRGREGNGGERVTED